MNLSALSGVAITLVVAGIVIALGLSVMGETKEQFYDDNYGVGCNASSHDLCGAEYNATQDAVEGVAKLSSKLPLIGLVFAAVIVIGLIVGAFATRS